MLALSNPGPFKAKAVPLADANGADVLVVVVRGTFDLQGRLLPEDEQTPVVEVDEYWGEPDSSSLEAASDISLEKLGTDIVLQGHAHPAPGGGRCTGEVGLRVASLQKSALVFGERVWNKRWFGMEISPPKPFEKVPLKWEFAYGGSLQAATAGGMPLVEVRNPVGRGLWCSDSGRPQDGLPLPQIEAPQSLLQTRKDKGQPCGFGPIARHWEPRIGYAGTYDEAWQKARAPVLPGDFDQRFFNIAPANQVTPVPLNGGEAVEITGVSASGPLRFALPQWRHAAACRFAGRVVEAIAKVATVVINTDESRLVLVWNAVFPCDREMLQIRELSVDSRKF